MNCETAGNSLTNVIKINEYKGCLSANIEDNIKMGLKIPFIGSCLDQLRGSLLGVFLLSNPILD